MLYYMKDIMLSTYYIVCTLHTAHIRERVKLKTPYEYDMYNIYSGILISLSVKQYLRGSNVEMKTWIMDEERLRNARNIIINLFFLLSLHLSGCTLGMICCIIEIMLQWPINVEKKHVRKRIFICIRYMSSRWVKNTNYLW